MSNDNYVHGAPQHAKQSMEMQTEPDFLSVSAEQGHDVEPFMSPVLITGEITERAATFGGYASYVFLGTETAPLRVLQQDTTRARAYITCSGNGPVYVGTDRDSLQAARSTGVPASGQVTGVFVLPAGVTLPVTHQGSVLVIPDGTHSATVSVSSERWK
jgi:hypothetical protein